MKEMGKGCEQVIQWRGILNGTSCYKEMLQLISNWRTQVRTTEDTTLPYQIGKN